MSLALRPCLLSAQSTRILFGVQRYSHARCVQSIVVTGRSCQSTRRESVSWLHNQTRRFSNSPANNPQSSKQATQSGSQTVADAEAKQGFLTRFLAPKPMPEKGTFAWYREMVLICTVFAITGSSTMMLVSMFIPLQTIVSAVSSTLTMHHISRLAMHRSGLQ
jgi:hypothetical protein